MEELLEQILDQLIMINQKLNLNTAESLPDLITIDHIRKYLNIGKNKAYEILNNSKFTSVNDGRKKCILKEEFLQHVDREHKRKKLKLSV